MFLLDMLDKFVSQKLAFLLNQLIFVVADVLLIIWAEFLSYMQLRVWIVLILKLLLKMIWTVLFDALFEALSFSLSLKQGKIAVLLFLESLRVILYVAHSDFGSIYNRLVDLWRLYLTIPDWIHMFPLLILPKVYF
jgi:hypothetical protein